MLMTFTIILELVQLLEVDVIITTQPPAIETII